MLRWCINLLVSILFQAKLEMCFRAALLLRPCNKHIYCRLFCAMRPFSGVTGTEALYVGLALNCKRITRWTKCNQSHITFDRKNCSFHAGPREMPRQCAGSQRALRWLRPIPKAVGAWRKLLKHNWKHTKAMWVCFKNWGSTKATILTRKTMVKQWLGPSKLRIWPAKKGV